MPAKSSVRSPPHIFSLNLLQLREKLLIRDDALLDEQLSHRVQLDSIGHHKFVGVDKLLIIQFLGHGVLTIAVQ